MTGIAMLDPGVYWEARCMLSIKQQKKPDDQRDTNNSWRLDSFRFRQLCRTDNKHVCVSLNGVRTPRIVTFYPNNKMLFRDVRIDGSSETAGGEWMRNWVARRQKRWRGEVLQSVAISRALHYSIDANLSARRLHILLNYLMWQINLF